MQHPVHTAPIDVFRISELRDLRAEKRLVHRVLIATAMLVPVGAALFSALIFVATRIAGVPAGGPVAMGAATGVLAGFFFGTWAGVVSSVNDIEYTEGLADTNRGEPSEKGDRRDLHA